MKKEVAYKWIEALRSGKYEQGKNRLRKEDKFCCLGVLCDISEQGTWKHKIKKRYVVEKEGASFTLSSKILDWAGLNFYNGQFDPSIPALSELNDNGKTFEEIADII
jgi:hypothetical protein